MFHVLILCCTVHAMKISHFMKCCSSLSHVSSCAIRLDFRTGLFSHNAAAICDAALFVFMPVRTDYLDFSLHFENAVGINLMCPHLRQINVS